MILRDSKKRIGYIIIILISIVLVIRALFTFGEVDESFYLALTDRLWKGNRLVLDEWHPTQFFFLLLLPLYSVYRIIVVDGSGVYLAFRILAIALRMCLACVVYNKIRKYMDCMLSTLAAIMVLIYSRGNISGITYYNVFAIGLLLGTIFLLESVSNNTKKDAFSAGIAIAMVTCAMPFAVIIDVVLIVVLLVLRKQNQLVYAIAGGCLTVIPIGLYTLLSINNSELFLKSVPYLFVDEEHTISRTRILFNTLYNIAKLNGILGCTWIMLGMITVLVVAFNKKELPCKETVLLLAPAIMTCIRIVVVAGKPAGVYVVMTCVYIPMILDALITRKSEAVRWGTACYFLGVASGIVFSWGSNVNWEAFSTGCPLSMIGILMVMGDYVSDKGQIARNVLVILMIAVGTGCLLQRVLLVSHDADALNEAHSRVSCGPLEGLYLSEERYKTCMEYCELAKYIDNQIDYNRVYINGVPNWMYVSLQGTCGSNSVYGYQVATERFDTYYQLEPQRIPELVLIRKYDDSSNDSIPVVRVGKYIKAKYEDEGYTHINNHVADVYYLKKR